MAKTVLSQEKRIERNGAIKEAEKFLAEYGGGLLQLNRLYPGDGRIKEFNRHRHSYAKRIVAAFL